MLQILYSGKDEAGNLPGRKLSSCSSPRIPSRSSSRFSFLDEFDDSEFTCPFPVEDEDLAGSYRYVVMYSFPFPMSFIQFFLFYFRKVFFGGLGFDPFSLPLMDNT